jgi:hypothetical protein
MGYFEGCVDWKFKKNHNGLRTFHPYIMFGRGYVLTSEEKYHEIRAFELKALRLTIFLSWAVPILLLISLWKNWHLRKMTKNLERTNDRLKIADMLENSFQSHSLTISIVCFSLSIGFVFFGLYIIFLQTHLPREIASVTYGKFGVNILALLAIATFGMCAFMWAKICVMKLTKK